MSKITIALISFIFLWIAVKIGFLVNGQSDSGFHAGVFINMSALILLPFLSLKFAERNQETSFLDDLKRALRPGMIYAVVITFGIFAYYKYIDPEFTANKYKDAIAILEQSAANDEAYKILQDTDSSLKDLSREEYMKRSSEGIGFIYSASVQTGASLLALFLTTIVYSLFVTWFYRLLLTKITRQ